MRKANIKGALVGVEAVTPEGLKAVYKNFNYAGDELAVRLRAFKENGIHVLGSFIFGLPTDRAETFDATAALAQKADLTFAQFVMMTPFPGTVDFERWERKVAGAPEYLDGIPITRYWLIPATNRPKMFTPHPTMSADEIRERTQAVWDHFYQVKAIWKRSNCVRSLKARFAFFFVSKLYRQMYAKTGISADSARRQTANRWARLRGHAIRQRGRRRRAVFAASLQRDRTQNKRGGQAELLLHGVAPNRMRKYGNPDRMCQADAFAGNPGWISRQLFAPRPR